LNTTALSNLSIVELDPVDFRALLRASKEAFLEFFLAEEMVGENGVPDFHLLVFNRFTDLTVRKDVAALPREHAKTTLLRLAMVYLIYFSPVQFFVYLSSAHHIAVPSLESIWARLWSDDALQIFGPPETLKERIAQGHIELNITAYDEEMRPYNKLVILKALGAGQALRGMNEHNLRPQYVAADDIEDETAVKTEEGYLKLKGWSDNTLGRAVARTPGRSKIAQIGNLIGLKTLLNDNVNDPDWRSIRLGIIRSNGQPLWPDSFSLEFIRNDFLSARRRGQLSAWFGELMNMPLNTENALIPYDQITTSPLRNPDEEGRAYRSFITIDPAISKKASADECAIVLHTLDEAGIPQVTEYVHQQGMDPSDMAREIMDMADRWNCRVVGCEAVQLQVVLLSYFEIAFAMDNRHGFEFVPIHVGQQHKTARLRTWAAALRDGEYTLAENDWDVIQQLVQFDVRRDNNSDDLIDACSMGLYMLSNYADLIFAERAGTQGKRYYPVRQAQTSF